MPKQIYSRRRWIYVLCLIYLGGFLLPRSIHPIKSARVTDLTSTSMVFSALQFKDFATLDSNKPPPSTAVYPSQVTQAQHLHQRGIKGNNIGIAIIDSGMPPINQNWTQLTTNTLQYTHGNRQIIYKDFITDVPITNSSDPFGHGTHVLASIADERQVGGNTLLGVAPEADLIVLRALDETGSGTYADVIEAIEWVIDHKTDYNIRVLNLSLQAPIHGPYWHDALAQATMHAWQSGIVVVVAAGNQGPDPATITVPGNVPYVITVGSSKPAWHTTTGSMELAQYSSAGPTESKFIKPDILVPGSQVIAPLPRNSGLSQFAGAFEASAKLKLGGATSQDKLNYYYLSGTSMAAAETSGIVALMLEDEPNLTNNQVKHRLLVTAQRAITSDQQPAYAIWQQGAGHLSTINAIDTITTDSANIGLDISLDRNHETGTHYVGDTEYNEQTNIFSVANLPEPIAGYTTWQGQYNPATHSFLQSSGYGIWIGGYGIWIGSYSDWNDTYETWAGGYGIWIGSTSIWSSSYRFWSGFLANDNQAATTFLPNVIK